MIEFFVPGSPVAAGSKRAFPIAGTDGRTHVSVTDASGPKGKEWRAAIRLAASQALGRRGPLAGALRVSLWFYVKRPRSHVTKHGDLRRSAPHHPTTRPDVLKLARAVEDACTSVLWTDDAQIVDELIHKLYADGDLRVGVQIFVTELVHHAPRVPDRDGDPVTRTA